MGDQILILTEDEVQWIRSELSQYRAAGNYAEGKWDVSAYNRAPQVVGTALPKKVALRDITLRVIEQAYGVVITPEQRLRLAMALDEVGVPELQVSLGAYSPPWAGTPDWTAEEQIKAMKNLGLSAKLTVEGIMTKEEIARAADAGIDIVQFFVPCSPCTSNIHHWRAYNLAWRGEDWRNVYPLETTVEDQIELAVDLIEFAREKGVKVSAGGNLLSYATETWLRQFFGAVGKAGADYTAIYDSSSGMEPEAWRHVTRIVKEAAPDCKLAVHAHNGFGLALANSLAAVQAGADIIEVSVNGLGSLTTGQADIAEVAAALTALYGIDTGLRLNKMVHLSRLVEDISRLKMLASKPITGPLAFATSSEIGVNELAVDPLLHDSLNPEVVGNKKVLYVSKISGNWATRAKLQELGIQADRGCVEAILSKVKAETHVRRRILTDDEIGEIATDVLTSTEGEK